MLSPTLLRAKSKWRYVTIRIDLKCVSAMMVRGSTPRYSKPADPQVIGASRESASGRTGLGHDWSFGAKWVQELRCNSQFLAPWLMRNVGTVIDSSCSAGKVIMSSVPNMIRILAADDH